MKYTWHINKLEVYPLFNGFKNVVKKIHYTLVAKENEFSSWKRGIFICNINSENNFTDYKDLTFEQICEWIETELDIIQIKTDLVNEIENQKNPPLEECEIPWNNNSENAI